MTDTTFIYVLIDPRTEEIRYVGKTGNPKKRLIDHVYEARSGRHPHKRCEWIVGLLALGMRPKLEIIQEVEVTNWEQAEIKQIAKHTKHCNLLNMTAGGVVIAERRKNCE